MGRHQFNESILAVAAIPSVVNSANIAPITGLCATSRTRPLSIARNSAASNSRLPDKVIIIYHDC
jgi:hypothetical protein